MSDSADVMTGSQIQNVLTFDKWSNFFNTLTDEQLHRHYDDIVEIPGVYEHFLEWEEGTQRQLIRWTASECRNIDIALIVKLRMNLVELYPDVHWHESDTFKIRTLASKSAFAFSKEHDALIFSLSHDARLGAHIKYYYADIAEISLIAAWLLSMIYGKARVGEVIQKFLNSNLDEYSVSDLGAIIERWDEFHEYPIEWAVNALDN